MYQDFRRQGRPGNGGNGIRLGYGFGGEDDGYGRGNRDAWSGAACGGPAFQCQCAISPKGKVTEKIEISPSGRDVFSYEYDAAGHLTVVRKNELVSEFYEFDEGGRRVLDFRAWAGGKRRLTYNYDGTLIQAGNVHLKWTEQGQLAAIEEDGRRTSFYYGHDTRLDRALLADGTDIRYHYGHELLPVQVTVNGALAVEYQWADKLKLLRCKDARLGLHYDFSYADQRAPLRVMVSGSAMAIYQATGLSLQRLELDVLVDQVDSIRALCLPDGRIVKYIEYDSFGNVISDNRPEWQFPLGFACGLLDPWTGLLRFGFRDYDPKFGRFTAKDPIGDTGGDHDLWDYCVDDPVSCIDSTGLESEDAVDQRPWWKKALAWYSPLIFGNDQERRAKKKSLHRSLEKEVRGMAYGFADTLTVVPKKLPTSIGIWGVDNLTEWGVSDKLREAVARDKTAYEQRMKR